MATIRTGSHAFVRYGYESTFGDSATATADRKFGVNDRLTNWSLTNQRVDLPALNQVAVENYAYGQQQGSLGMTFNLSNPWVFASVFNKSTQTGSYTNVFGSNTATAMNKEVKGITVQIGIGGDVADILRTASGCIANSLSVSASVGDVVECSMDMTYGIENAVSGTLGSAPTGPAEEFPYTFAHGVVTYGDAVLATVQDVDITFAQNAELLYKVGSHQAVSTYRRIFDITGTFRAAHLDKTVFDDLFAQINQGSYAETVKGRASPPTVEFKLVFQNKTSTPTSKIEIEGFGLSPSDLGISGIAPGEPIFENVSWRVKTCKVTSTTAASAPNDTKN